MHKVYLLIRRNKQTGPYTLEELVQLELQQFDLIWVEGKSAAWSYPSEISALQPYLKKDSEAEQASVERVPRAAQPDNEPPKVSQEIEPLKVHSEPASLPGQSSHEAFMPTNAAKDSPKMAPSPRLVYMSHPKNKNQDPTRSKAETPGVNIEKKAEELRKRAESYIPEKKTAIAAETLKTKYTRPLDEIEEDFATWTYQNKTKKQVQLPVKAIMSIVIGVFVIGGTYAIARFAFSTSQAPASKDTVIDNRQNPELTTEKLILETPPSNKVAVEKVPDRPLVEEKAPAKIVKEEKTPVPILKREEPVVTNDRKAQKPAAEVVAWKKSPPVTEPKSKQKASTLATSDTKNENPVKEPVATNTSKTRPATGSRQEEPVVAVSPQKKKSFDERVDEFISQFKRKKTEEKPAVETTTEEAQPPVSNTGVTERKARRRDDEPVTSPEPQNLEEFIEVSSNQPSENWMLGIHNLKLTVSNRGSVPVKKAAVEIRYLNNLNEVIDKKVLNVTNIPARKSVTLPAPDHRLAERMESRVLSAEGN